MVGSLVTTRLAIAVVFSADGPSSMTVLGCACVSVGPTQHPSVAEALYKLQRQGQPAQAQNPVASGSSRLHGLISVLRHQLNDACHCSAVVLTAGFSPGGGSLSAATCRQAATCSSIATSLNSEGRADRFPIQKSTRRQATQRRSGAAASGTS